MYQVQVIAIVGSLHIIQSLMLLRFKRPSVGGIFQQLDIELVFGQLFCFLYHLLLLHLLIQKLFLQSLMLPKSIVIGFIFSNEKRGSRAVLRLPQ